MTVLESIIIGVAIAFLVMFYVWNSVREIRQEILRTLKEYLENLKVKIHNDIIIALDEDMAKVITEYYINGGFNKSKEEKENDN